jgi:3-hydroxymyristoyl/3-hydroxydecanoyl-(acyl carrier protein) dehydratase
MMVAWKGAHREPEILSENIEAEKVVLELRIVSTLFQFQGHFPSQLVLPGVAQLDWAVRYGMRFFKLSLPVKEVLQLKYRHFIIPDIDIILELNFRPHTKSIAFIYKSADKIFSSGTIGLKEV